jgi:hypothetical protein
MLKQYLASLSKEELIEEIHLIAKRFNEVNQYYQARLEPHKTEDVLAAYKTRISREFFTAHSNPGPLRLGVARKAVLDFSKIQANITHLIDLELFYVEQGVKFTNTFGDIDEPFYVSIERMFERALNDVRKHGMEDGYADRIKKIVNDTRDIGWGFGDQMKHIYHQYFSSNY